MKSKKTKKKNNVHKLILTKRKKDVIIKLNIGEFRNNFAKYRKMVHDQGFIIIIYKDSVPILVISKYEFGILDSIRKETK